MITAYSIGTNGRLGNQMFQYAALHGIARANGFAYWSPGGRLFEVFTMDGCQNVPPIVPPDLRVEEASFGFDSRFLNRMIDNVDLHGYFQTEMYWSHVRNEIVKMFEFKKDIKNVPRDLLEFCQSSKFLHVRRTDYISSNGYHPTLDFDYYLNLVESGESVSIFTDDNEWGEKLRKKCEKKGNASVLMSNKGLRDVQELYLMTNCNSAVIANSSFSWWGAYLGPHQRGQKVIAPKNWFGSQGPQDTADLYVENWVKV